MLRRSLPLPTLLAVGSLLLAAACPQRSSAPARLELIRKPGVLVARVGASELPKGRTVDGKLGDWLIQADGFRAVIGATEPRSPQPTAGALLDLTDASWDDDALERLRASATAFGRRLRLRVQSVELVDADPDPALRVVERSDESGLELTTFFMPRRDRLEIVTRATNGGGRVLEDVGLGDELRWYGRAPFVPGAGYVLSHRRTAAPWLAVTGEAVGYALILGSGGGDVTYAPTLHAPSELFTATAGAALAPGATLERRRTLLVAKGSLGRLSERAWRALGVPLGRVAGRFEPAPAWGVLTAYGADGGIVLEVETAPDGSYELPLPAGGYKLRLSSAGGVDETALTVAADTVVATDLTPPVPARLRVLVADEQGRKLPARVIVRGQPPTPDPVLGPAHSAKGAGFVAYTATGDSEIELSPGNYDVVVTHGPEFSISEHRIEVSRGRGVVVRARLEQVLDTPGWFSADFHVHAEPSPDSDVPLRDRVTSLLADGVEFAVATDHNHLTSYAGAIQELGAEQQIASAGGVEITTRSWGHFNSFPYPPGEPPPYTDVTPEQIFGAVRQRAPAALIQVNHPHMGDIGYFVVGGLEPRSPRVKPGFSYDFDTLEVFNGFERGDLPQIEQNLAAWYRLLEAGRRYVAVGNSDSHWLVHEWVGYPRTYVRVDARGVGELTPDGVAAALKRGRAVVSNGPFVDLAAGDRGIGDLVSAPGGKLAVEVVARAAPWVDLTRVDVLVNGALRGQVERKAQQPSLSASVQLSLAADSWVIAIARGTAPMERVLPGANAVPFAFTNPLYVDVDGDGKFRGQ